MVHELFKKQNLTSIVDISTQVNHFSLRWDKINIKLS